MRHQLRWLLPGAYLALAVCAIAILLGVTFFNLGGEDWGFFLLAIPYYVGLPWTLILSAEMMPGLRPWMPFGISPSIVAYILGVAVNLVVLYMLGAALDRWRALQHNAI